MHQTVKDFIGLSGFCKLIMQDENLLAEENSYTLLSKQMLARSSSGVLKYGSNLGEPDRRKERKTFWVGRRLLYDAEVSTGKSQKLLLDELDNGVPSNFGNFFSLLMMAPPFTSVISFGMVCNVCLYFKKLYKNDMASS
jgi:hypothetical protein